MKTNIFSKLYTLIAITCIFVMTVFPATQTSIAHAAGSAYDVLGYAWSYHPIEQSGDYRGNNATANIASVTPLGTQGFGWISMSGTNSSSGGGSYNVTLDPTTGKFAGYAWSENGGWVNFAPSGNYPTVAGTTAKSAYVDPACLADKTKTCDVKGWIRFMGGAAGNSSWDGWVNMEIFSTQESTTGFALAINSDSDAKGVVLLPESNGYRNMEGYAWGDWLAGIIGFAQARVKIDQIDVCPDTKFNQTSNPKNTGVDPATAGTQTTIPKGYSVKDGMCGIFGCTDKAAANFVKTATVDDGSCLNPDVDICTNISGVQTEVPAGYTKNPATPGIPGVCTKDPLCTPKSDDYNPISGICEECHPGVKNCYIIGCTDPYAKNYNKDATMSANPNICTYDPGVETCKQRGDCPSYPTAPKKPVYIET